MDENTPESIGDNPLAPSVLTPAQEALCKRLDDWYARYNLKVKPSDMFRGAIFAMRPECRSNPDWIAQAAHSLRDILYPFHGKGVIPKRKKALKEYGSVRADDTFDQELGRLLGTLTELAHHSNGRGSSVDFSTYTAADFEKLVVDFERIVFDSLARQIDVHAEIDNILKEDPNK